MIVWHATKTLEALQEIQRTKIILPGRNVKTKTYFTHFSTSKFEAGGWALDVIGNDTNEAWILELQISNTITLVDDPADDGGLWYGGDWVIHDGPVPFEKIVRIDYVENVQKWELEEIQACVWR